MQCGRTLVAVMVTHVALDNIELATPGVGGHLACFNKHRDALEQIASATSICLKVIASACACRLATAPTKV